MEWPQLIIALIVIAAYVIKHIVTAQQERQAAALRAQFNTAAPVVAQSEDELTQQLTELDRRIQDARDRPDRRAAERSALPLPVVAPVPRYEPPLPKRDRTAQAQVRRVPRSELPRVVEAEVSKTPKRDAPAVAAIRQMVFAPVELDAPRGSPAVRQALELLKDRQTLAAAFVLREILDRPMALRRRRL